MILTLIRTEPETADVESFIFRPDRPFTWHPGQYLHYTLPHPEIDDRGVQRFFTIASAPYEGEIRLTTRFAIDQGSSFKRALRTLEIGDTVTADDAPSGEFTLERPTGQYVFIAGGIGVTPFRSIIKDLTHRNLPYEIGLIYANRNDQIVFRDDFDQISAQNPHLQVRYLIDPERITPELITREIPEPGAPSYYLSGPRPMVDSVQNLLMGLGVGEDRIKRDAFPGYD